MRRRGADKGGGDGDEGQEVVGAAFVAAVEPPAAGRPGDGPLDDPAVAAQPLTGLDPMAGDTRDDAAPVQQGAGEGSRRPCRRGVRLPHDGPYAGGGRRHVFPRPSGRSRCAMNRRVPASDAAHDPSEDGGAGRGRRESPDGRQGGVRGPSRARRTPKQRR
jgi:hypothetical protein